MPEWLVRVLDDPAAGADALSRGEVLALDIDPRHPRLLLRPIQPGLGDAEVGQRALYRRWLGAGGEDTIESDELDAVLDSARAWLTGDDCAALLDRISSGYRRTRYWTGDELGEWTPDAWAAANAIFMGVVTAMESVDGTPTP